MEEIKIFNESERDILLAKKGTRNIKVSALCRECSSMFETKLFRLEKGLVCRKCKISLTKKSVDDATKKSISEKRKATTLKRYGVENVFQSNVIKEKSKQTLKQNYGVENAKSLQLDPSYKKKEEAPKPLIENQEDGFEDRSEELSSLKLTKWDLRTEEERESILQKRKNSNLKKYGEEFAQRSDVVKNKVKENSLKKWGFEYPQQSEIVRKKTEDTLLERYGSKHPNSRYRFQSQVFDSSWELYVYLWALDHNLKIEREPIELEYYFEGIKHKYFPDFRIGGKLIEVKGPQFFKDGKMVNPYDHSLDALFEAKHQCGLNNNVIFFSKEKIEEIKKEVDAKYTEDFVPLFLIDSPFPYPKLSSKSPFDVIRFFHKSIYWARRQNNKSPYEAWQDKDLVLKSALNRLRYVKRCTPDDIIIGFNVAKIAPKVSVFKPSLAEKLVKKYLSDCSEIVDPFSGFSGRMLGVNALGKSYRGFDINEDHVRESNEIIGFLKLNNCKVEVQDLLKNNCVTESDALFTCPPYGAKEHWNKNSDEVELSCDEWIGLCLEKYKCKKYLFVVDETKKYKDNIVEEIQNKSHLGTKCEYVVLI